MILPALRYAVDDLDELVPLFVAEYNAKAGRQVKDIPMAVWQKLKAHHWSGNVRELRNVIERCVLFSEGPVFPITWLQLPGQEKPFDNRNGQTGRKRDPSPAMAAWRWMIWIVHHQDCAGKSR